MYTSVYYINQSRTTDRYIWAYRLRGLQYKRGHFLKFEFFFFFFIILTFDTGDGICWEGEKYEVFTLSLRVQLEFSMLFCNLCSASRICKIVHKNDVVSNKYFKIYLEF